MTPYPVDLPVEAARLVVADIRNGSVLADRANFAKAVWELAGYALKSSLGDPTPVTVKAEPPLTDAEVADYLSQVAYPQGPASVLIANLPWKAILKWALTTLLELL